VVSIEFSDVGRKIFMIVNTPRVSVLMSVYNGRRYLDSTIASVLDQSFADFELIVVDDCSQDDTKDVLEGFSRNDSRIKLLKNEHNLGLTKSLNIGLKRARGEYIARIDNGDLWSGNKLTKQIDYFMDRHDLLLLGTQAICLDDNGLEIGTRRFPIEDREIRLWLIKCQNPFLHSSVVFRNRYLYDEQYYTSQDLALWTRVFFDGRMANLNDVCVYYRISREAVSYKRRAIQIYNSYNIYKDFSDALTINQRVSTKGRSNWVSDRHQLEKPKKLFAYVNYLANKLKNNNVGAGVFLAAISYLLSPRLFLIKLMLKYATRMNYKRYTQWH